MTGAFADLSQWNIDGAIGRLVYHILAWVE
jgi:hypothetical protein